MPIKHDLLGRNFCRYPFIHLFIMIIFKTEGSSAADHGDVKCYNTFNYLQAICSLI